MDLKSVAVLLSGTSPAVEGEPRPVGRMEEKSSLDINVNEGSMSPLVSLPVLVPGREHVGDVCHFV